MQVADTPGRFEPGTGEISYDFIFGHLHRIGCKHKPAGVTEDGLGWLASVRLALAVEL